MKREISRAAGDLRRSARDSLSTLRSTPGYESTAERLRRPRGRLVTALAMLLGILAGMGVFDKIIMPQVVRHGREVRVPSVGGKDIREAEAEVRDAGLDPVRAPGQVHSQVPRGRVLDVSPAAGLSVKRGRQVYIIPSLGPVDRMVPELVGESVRIARLRLMEASLRIGRIDYAATDLVEPDRVLAASPEPGSPAPENGQVTILVSQALAPTPYCTPDLRGRDISEAATWLRAAGFRVALEEGAGSRGAVAAVDPPPGTPIWPGATVTLRSSYDQAPAEDRW